MSEPFIDPRITQGIQYGAAALDFIPSILTGIAQIEQGKAVDKRLRNQATQVELIGLMNAAKRRTEAARFKGTQTAVFAKSGVAVGVGSALDIELRTAVLEEMAALNEQLPFQQRAAHLRGQGKIAKRGARGQGIQTILGGVARAIGHLPAGVPAPEDTEVDTTPTEIDFTEFMTEQVVEIMPFDSMPGPFGNVPIVDIAPPSQTLGPGGTD